MLSVAQLCQDRKPESAQRLVYKRHTHSLESNETVTGGSRVKAACVSDTLHLNQLLPSCCSTAPWSFYIHDKLMERAWLQIRKRSGFCFSCMTLLFLTFTPVFRFFIFLPLLFCVSAVFWVWRLSASHARVKTARGRKLTGQHRCEIKKSVGHRLCCKRPWHMFRRTGSTRGAGHTIPSRGCWLVETAATHGACWVSHDTVHVLLSLQYISISPPIRLLPSPPALSHYPRLPPACDIYL